MNAIKYLFVMIFVSLISCEDVLNREPLDKISEVQVWQNEKMMEGYVTYLYNNFPFYSFSGFENYSDEQSRPNNSNNITTGKVNRTSEGAGYWDYSYIRECNVFLEKVATSDINNNVKRQLEGEVRFIRAFIYFEMMKRYGGVPLVDVVIDPYLPIEDKFLIRANEEDIADFIDRESTLAASLLNDKSTPLGRANKWTALALQARSNLWAASIAKYGKIDLEGVVGIPATKASVYYQKASASADAVINSGKYTLYNENPDNKAENYRNIFLVENNKERIFVKVFDGVNITHSFDNNNPPQFSVKGGGDRNPTLEFLLRYEDIDGSDKQLEFGPNNLYDNGFGPFVNKDPRLKASVFFNGDKWGGGAIQTYEGLDPSELPNPTNVIRNLFQTFEGMPCAGLDSRSVVDKAHATSTGFHNKKYLDESMVRIPLDQSKTDWIVFRLAEMYLIKAEAEFELGNNNIAVEALNFTRKRAGISLVNEATITREKIRKERASELYMEGHRYWDLRRWRIAHEVLNQRFSGLEIIFHYSSGKFYFLPMYCEPFSRVFNQEHYYNPITDSRINNNPKLIENPLY